MKTLFVGILAILLPALVLAQSSITPTKYEPATIVDVKLHPAPVTSSPDEAIYEVSVKVARTIYVVLTPSPPPTQSIRYAIGREVLVHVGADTITWNDILGQSHEVPIVSRTLIADTAMSQSR